MEFPPNRAIRAAEIIYILTIITVPFSQHAQAVSVRVKKPVYNIVHMVNSLDKFDAAMDSGANAIQMDVELRRDGSAYLVRYGEAFNCRCSVEECERKEEFIEMLKYIRETTANYSAKYGRKLCLVVLHIKSNISWAYKYNSGVRIAEQLVNYLWSGVAVWNAMNVLFSVESSEDEKFISGANATVFKLMPHMINKIGYDARFENDLVELGRMYTRLGIEGNYWQGDGSATCLLAIRNTARLQTVLDLRDTESRHRYPRKVYHWVVDIPIYMQGSLQRGVDAIITNRPGQLCRVLRYALNATHRLATIVDSPWKRFDGWRPYLRLPPTGTEHLGDNNLTVVRGVNG